MSSFRFLSRAPVRARFRRATGLASVAALALASTLACRGAARTAPDPGASDAVSIEVTRGSIKRRAERAASAPPFWLAVSLVDVDGAERGARTTEERLFAGAYRALVEGRDDDALVLFGGLERSGDATVQSAARMGRTLVLQWQGHWADIAQLAARGEEPATDDRASIFAWARGFADLPPTSVRVAAGSTHLPLRLSTAGTPVVAVRVNGVERYFWLDTGASLSIIAADVAHDLGVRELGADTLALATWGGRVPARPGVADRIDLGPLQARAVPVAILDPAALQFPRAVRPGEPDATFRLDGVIGTDLLRQLSITLDVHGGEITLARPPRRAADDRAHRRNLFWLGFPVVRLTAGSGRPGLLGVDTGADSTTIGESWFLVDSTSQLRDRAGRLVGLGATSVSTLQVVRDVLLSDGSFTVRLRNVTVAPERRSTFVTMDGVLGSDFIRSAIVHIDFVNGVFSVRPPRPVVQRDPITVTYH